MSAPGIETESGLAEAELARLDAALRKLVAAGFAPWPRTADDSPLWLCRWWTGGHADLVLLDGPRAATLVRVFGADPFRPQETARAVGPPRHGEPETVLGAAMQLRPPTPSSSRLSVRSSHCPQPLTVYRGLSGGRNGGVAE